MDEKFNLLLEELQKIKGRMDGIDNRLKKIEDDREQDVQNQRPKLSIVKKNSSLCCLNDYKPSGGKSYANNTDLDLESIWNDVLNVIKKELTEVSFNTWFKVIKPLNIDDYSIYLSVPNEFTKGIIEARYSELIETAIDYVTDKRYSIVISDTIEEESELTQEQIKSAIELSSNTKSKYSFENLMIGEHNRFAYKALLEIAQDPKEKPRLTYIYSGVGLGKTHMLKALENYIFQNHLSTKVKYMHVDDFIRELITSISKDNNNLFRENIINNDVLILDDLHHIIGKERSQEELIKILNTMIEKGKSVVIGCTKPPQEIFLHDEKFTSLFEIEDVIKIVEPDMNTRIKILEKKAEKENSQLDNEVITLIARIFSSNIRELINAFNRVISYSKSASEKINTKSAITALTGFSAVSMEEISENFIENYSHIKIGQKYRHFKGKEYLVLSLAKHSETLEELVVYQALYGEYGIWVRPLSMFIEQVEVDGKMINRFEEIE